MLDKDRERVSDITSFSENISIEKRGNTSKTDDDCKMTSDKLELSRSKSNEIAIHRPTHSATMSYILCGN